MARASGLPGQIILLADALRGHLRLALSAATLEAARGDIAAASELADTINQLASDAASASGGRDRS